MVFGIIQKKYPNTKRQKVAIAVTLIGLIGSFTVTPWVFNSINTKSEQTQTTISSSSHSSDYSSFSSSKINDSSTSEEKEKQEKEREEQARKEAEAKQIAEAADQAVQQLENNPVQENISSAQAAVEHVVDPTTKASLTERIVQAQNTINQRAEEARQEAERQAAEQQQTRTVYVARFGKADVYWYSMENMPSNTRFDRVITMTEADAIASEKRHTSKE